MVTWESDVPQTHITPASGASCWPVKPNARHQVSADQNRRPYYFRDVVPRFVVVSPPWPLSMSHYLGRSVAQALSMALWTCRYRCTITRIAVLFSAKTACALMRYRMSRYRCDCVRFPNLIVMFQPLANMVLLISSFGPAIVPLIAAGCGHLGDERPNRLPNGLLVEDQIEIGQGYFQVDIPKRINSFMAVMAGLMNEPEKPKRVKVRSMKSPSASPPLSATDSRPTMQ